ncbi:BZ3500_MvSof-1268-A1-R1_Chr1-1g01160 [Microbotryum saponariae]|uniref:BZ3500_MvSof-1268-A1-R1_Chr1-1g01160 protein n=1 Tax=Microbotryum saponariae TaxID=289078 RepID=A0A2X0KJB7_9BASI|nr:BZ3500_MvSof-1268-A1-R1_Chr1-1g01160 [Microbotryum saponariae]SCZ93539.1 BZ3501_MvSof-1269-A2-R1_Chr1-1g00757 [Microbotryum saponariae]
MGQWHEIGKHLIDRIQLAEPTNGEAAGGLHPPPVGHTQDSLQRWSHRRRTGAGGRRGPACSQLDPEKILDLPDYSRFYAEVREGLFTSRKYAKGYPTQLPVTVDEHPGQLAQEYSTLGSGHPG